MSAEQGFSRFYRPAGGALLALTAAPWLVKTTKTPEGTLKQDHSLWEMIGLVKYSYVASAIFAAVVITGFAVTCMCWPATNRKLGATMLLAAFGWFATITVAVVMASIDGGFHPGSAPWVGLVLCAVISVHTSARVLWFSTSPRPAEVVG